MGFGNVMSLGPNGSSRNYFKTNYVHRDSLYIYIKTVKLGWG